MDEISVNSHLKHTKPDLQLNGLIFKKVGDTDTGLEKVETKKINEIGFFGVKNNFWSGIDKLYFSTGTHIYKFDKNGGFKEQLIKINELEKDNKDVTTALIATKPIQDLNKDVKTSKINQIDIHHLNFGIYQRKILSSKYFKLTDDFLGIKEDGNKICLYSSKSANKFCFSQSDCSKSHNYLDEIFKSDDRYFAYSNVTQGSNAYIWEERAKITEHYPDPKNNTLNDCFKFLKSLADASKKIKTNSLQDRSTEFIFTFDDETERKLNFEKFFTENLDPVQFQTHKSSIEKLKNWKPTQDIPTDLDKEFRNFATQFKNRFNAKNAPSSTSTEVKYRARESAYLHFIPFIEVHTESKEIGTDFSANRITLPFPVHTPVSSLYSSRLSRVYTGNYGTSVNNRFAPQYKEVITRIRDENQYNPLPTQTRATASTQTQTEDKAPSGTNEEQFNFSDHLLGEAKKYQENIQKGCDEFIQFLQENLNKLFTPAPTQTAPNHTHSHTTPLPITYYRPPQYRISPPVKDRYNGFSAPNPQQRLRYEQRSRQEYEQLPDIRKQVPTNSHSFPPENPYSDRRIIQPGYTAPQLPPIYIQSTAYAPHQAPVQASQSLYANAQAPALPTAYAPHQAPVQASQSLYANAQATAFPTAYAPPKAPVQAFQLPTAYAPHQAPVQASQSLYAYPQAQAFPAKQKHLTFLPNPQIIPINNKTNLNAYYPIQCGSA